MKLPYLTHDLPGIGGSIKDRMEDFYVEELPLYDTVGKGTHVYFRVVKSGLTTHAAADRIAEYMGVRPADIGVAGLKDAMGITVQTMSLEHVDPASLLAYRDAQVRITDVTRHTNKLKIGHLAGNLFQIRIRGVGEKELGRAREILLALIRRGVPNFFGHQRFGARGDTAALGRALVKKDLDEFVAIYLGRSLPSDPPDCKAARDAFEAGFYNRALDRWPRHYANERKALSAYMKRKKPHKALAAIDRRMRTLYISAFQSEIFNRVLCERIDRFDKVLAGDLARKTDTGGIFPVKDAQAEAARAEQFEISATGPLPGYRCRLAEGEPGQIEQRVLDAEGVKLEDFKRVAGIKVKGSRRPLRFRIAEPAIAAGSDNHGDFIQVVFTAPPGCYATVVLRELMKNDEAD